MQQWFPPEHSKTASRPRSSTGPIGFIIDLHSQWHNEALRASNYITSMDASIIIPSGPPPAPYIALGKPLNSNYTIPRRAPVPDPPAETTVFQRSSSTSLGATKPRDKQRQSVQHRADHYRPFTQPATTADYQQLKCEGCGRKSHLLDLAIRRQRPRFYGKMDMTSGFFQTSIDAQSRPYTAFITSFCVLQALIHACSTPRFIDIQIT